MYGCAGCGLGDVALTRNFSWSHLGQDSTDSTDIVGPTLEEIAGGPVDTITAGDVATYVQTGQADPSVLTQIANIVRAAGPTVTGILQQVQFGQLASNTPISQLSQLRAAVTGTSTVQSVVSSLTANPAVLIIGAGLLFLLLRKRG